MEANDLFLSTASDAAAANDDNNNDELIPS